MTTNNTAETEYSNYGDFYAYTSDKQVSKNASVGLAALKGFVEGFVEGLVIGTICYLAVGVTVKLIVDLVSWLKK